MALPRSMDLQWQREVIERWLNSTDTPLDARPGLLEMLSLVNVEMEKLVALRNHLRELKDRRAS
jgi:hypothetical protein